METPEAKVHPPGDSLRRIRGVAAHTLTEALRLRLTIFVAAAGVGLVMLALWLREFNFGSSELKFICDFGFGAMGLMGTLLAALLTAHLFFSEISGGVIGCLLTRALRRWEYLVGKMAGIMVVLALFVIGLGLALFAVVSWRQQELGLMGFPLWLLLQAAGLIWLKITLVAAMTLFVSTYAGSMLFATCAGLMLAVVAQLRPLTEFHHGFAVLRLWPNLGLFDVEGLLAGAALDLVGLSLYWGMFLGLFTALSVYVVQRREF